MKKNIIKSYISIFCLFSSLSIFAQPGDTDGTPTDNLEGTDPPANINTALLLLLIIGIWFAIYSINNRQKTIS